MRRGAGLLLLATIALLSSCKKPGDAVTPTPAANDYATVNDWILTNMRQAYYWNDKIPANPDKTLKPDVFFDTLLYKFDPVLRPDGDRFSWIEESGDQLKSELSGETKTTGMEFTLYLRATGSSEVIAQVLYVLPNSPAQKAGLQRGDIIYQVNGQRLNRSNYSSLLFDNTVSAYTFKLAKISNQTIVDSDETRSVTPQVFQEDPVFLDSVYTVGARKVGYFVYNQFIPSPNGTENGAFDNEMDAVFANFKAQGINELVLDLRYNPGGYTSSSANLASLIGKGVDASKVYFREEWNKTLTPQFQKQYGDEFFLQRFVNKAQNVGGALSRVFILTSDRTASASELIINGLKPYMPVTLIGTTTYGKNVGSITITDDSGQIKWGMQPIVLRSYNSLGQSDYSTGFKPDVEVQEPLNLFPLGDVREDLLNEALYQISGVRLRRALPTPNPLPLVGSSIQRKAAGSNMFKTLKTRAL
jgi:C-terminal processing protease CtpA/Prc